MEECWSSCGIKAGGGVNNFPNSDPEPTLGINLEPISL